MNPIHILIVEDESIVAMEIEGYVKYLGYTVTDICSNAEDTLQVISEQNVDIVLMDICIKGELDGIETTERIRREHPEIEIIFLTAHLDDYNVNRAIALDPVAYLAKPFHREELRVFLKIAIQKLTKKHIFIDKTLTHIFLDNEFSYDEKNSILYCCTELIHLTKRETELLDILIQNRNNVVDLYTIENQIWPDKTANTNTIRTLVKRLREKLKHKFIETIPSYGYRFTLS